MIDTEWAYLQLKRAISTPTDDRSVDWAEEGIGFLFDAIERAGHRSPHTYVVLGREAVAWTAAGIISPDDQKHLLGTVKSVMEAGRMHHIGNRHFKEALREVEKAYLHLAVPKP